MVASFEAWVCIVTEDSQALQPSPFNYSSQPCTYLIHSSYDPMIFVSDSASIGFGTHASSSMSGIRDFLGPSAKKQSRIVVEILVN